MPCTFNINLTNRSGVALSKKDLAAIEKGLSGIFAIGGYRATLNNPGAASNPAFNFNLTVYSNFPNSHPQSARLDSGTIGYTLATRQIPDSSYPDIYFPGSTGGVSVNHIRASYGATSTTPSALAFLFVFVVILKDTARPLILALCFSCPSEDIFHAGHTAEGVRRPDVLAKHELSINAIVSVKKHCVGYAALSDSNSYDPNETFEKSFSTGFIVLPRTKLPKAVRKVSHVESGDAFTRQTFSPFAIKL